MDFFEKISKLDRRWVYLFLAVVVVIAFLTRFDVPVTITSEVKSIYDRIESLNEGDKILIAFDYDPNALAELHPMSFAILEHCQRRGVKVIGVTLSQYGAGMAENILRTASGTYAEKIDRFREYNQEMYEKSGDNRYRDKTYKKDWEYGIDYCFLGYKPYPALVILGMGQNFRLYFPQDYYNTPLGELNIMQGVRNYNDIKLAIDITAGNTADFWLIYGNGRYGVPLALGLTGVMGADYYQYLQSGQIFGLIGGWKGAAEYETLVDFQGGKAQEGMPAQVVAHLTIILFIVLGNLGYFLSDRRKKATVSQQV
ncbi:MAG: hypothetical protein GWO41_10320 [candidate division Zixibacteria bacterium]|nr:hypothetical protein [candidate division Zixibacteria bacterium]NIR64601.1 hypothetical protein [candidate division Zixibacteria bacterium]NIS16724.1 hypothetical protein [candidate division Zixibacteria bacterium]NIS46459.1 hypothetical protein [candidate division Zixibacteria bacterium]NIT53113.1 hypothetical protein [candidate division Zixibacteria bacterium]